MAMTMAPTTAAERLVILRMRSSKEWGRARSGTLQGGNVPRIQEMCRNAESDGRFGAATKDGGFIHARR
jgi:hypothetical protein